MFTTLLAATESNRSDFVDLDVSLWAWLGLMATIVTMLGVDLYRHRGARAPSTREALIESIAWVTCGLLFSVVVAIGFGSQAFGEYISSYLTEKSLSVDNVFVWSMLSAAIIFSLRMTAHVDESEHRLSIDEISPKQSSTQR